MNLLWIKVDVERFGFNNHHQDLDIRIVHIAMDACWYDRSRSFWSHFLKNGRFCLVALWSIFTFILSFRKNNFQIHSYTSNTDDFKTICICENLLVFAYFLINWWFCLVSFGNPTFSNTFPRTRHVLNSWIMNAMCTFVSFRCILFNCSCHPSKHPSLCELFCYPSPEDGYWNRNVRRRL